MSYSHFIVMAVATLLIGGNAHTSSYLEPGLYRANMKLDLFYSTFTLTADQSFNYEEGGSLFMATSAGTWEASNGRLVLRSYIQNPDNIDIVVEESYTHRK